MKHLKPINQKAGRIEAQIAREQLDVVGLESAPPLGPHIPLGCSLVVRCEGELAPDGGAGHVDTPHQATPFDGVEVVRVSSWKVV